MGAPPLEPELLTLDQLALRGPLEVAHQGRAVSVAVANGVEVWARFSRRNAAGAAQYVLQARALSAPTPTPAPAKPPGVVHHIVVRGAAANPSCTPPGLKDGDTGSSDIARVTCPDCLSRKGEVWPEAVPNLPLIRRTGHLGLVDLEALEPMRVDPDGDRATHHDSEEQS